MPDENELPVDFPELKLTHRDPALGQLYWDLQVWQNQVAQRYIDVRHRFQNQAQINAAAENRFKRLEEQAAETGKTVTSWKAYIIAISGIGTVVAFLLAVAGNAKRLLGG